MSAFGQSMPWKIEHPEYLVRPIDFAGIHQVEGHDDYSGDVDGLHLDYTSNCAVLIDIKYRRFYCGELNPRTQKTYEVLANAMTAGGVRTYVLIAGHDVDLHKEGAMVPIERCQALDVYYPKSRVWHAHAQDKADMNGVLSSPIDLSVPAVIQRLKRMGDDLDSIAGERVRRGQRSGFDMLRAVLNGVQPEEPLEQCPPYLRKGITYSW